MIEYGQLLRGAGFTVHEIDGWRTNSHDGEFTPQGGMWHHTTMLNDLDVLVHGRSDLAGPLANLYLRQDGSWTVVCGGGAWHAGSGTLSVLEDLRNGVAPLGDAAALGLQDDVKIANHFLIGIEVEGGVGDRDDFTSVQIDALVEGSAVLSREFGFKATQWIHHREWTNRKPDMGYRKDLRGRLATLLGSPATTVSATSTSSTTDTQHDTGTSIAVVNPPPPPVLKPEDVMYVVIEAPDRSPAFFTADGQGHAMGKGGWTFINRFATKHPGLVVFDTTWTAEEYDMVVRLPAHSIDDDNPPLPPGLGDGGGAPADPGAGLGDAGGNAGGGSGGDSAGGGPVDVTLPPDLLHLPDDVPEPSVGSFG